MISAIPLSYKLNGSANTSSVYVEASTPHIGAVSHDTQNGVTIESHDKENPFKLIRPIPIFTSDVEEAGGPDGITGSVTHNGAENETGWT